MGSVGIGSKGTREDIWEGVSRVTVGGVGNGCHGFARGFNVRLVSARVSGVEGAVARRRAAGFKDGGTHEPTNGFKMTEVGEGGRFWLVVCFGGTISLLSTGAAQGGVGVGGECACRA